MRSNQIIIGVIALFILIVAAYFAIGTVSASQIVKPGDNVQVYYTGAFTNGTVFDSNIGSQPLNFTVGANEVIPGFDQAVIGMKINQTTTLTIPVAEAYGPVNASLIVSLPLKDFGNMTVGVGNVIIETTTTGQELRGTVVSLNTTNATLDFNSPLAGHPLVFTIRVVGIQK